MKQNLCMTLVNGYLQGSDPLLVYPWRCASYLSMCWLYVLSWWKEREGLWRLQRAARGRLRLLLWRLKRIPSIYSKAMGLGGFGGEGQCRMCSHKHASGVCKTCSTRLDTERMKSFWVCYAGSHDDQCYRHQPVSTGVMSM